MSQYSLSISKCREDYWLDSVRRDGGYIIADRLDVDDVVWPNWEERRADPTRCVPVDQFAHLADADRREIVAFAQDFGLLGLCKCEKPHTHRADCEPTYREPIRCWRGWAQTMRSILSVSADLANDEVRSPSDWERIGEPTYFNRGSAEAYDGLGVVVTNLLALAGVRPSYAFGYDGTPWFDLITPWLFGAVAREVAFSVSRMDGPFVCAGCGEPYLRWKRRPKPGQNSWCSGCRALRLDKKWAKRQYSARQL